MKWRLIDKHHQFTTQYFLSFKYIIFLCACWCNFCPKISTMICIYAWWRQKLLIYHHIRLKSETRAIYKGPIVCLKPKINEFLQKDFLRTWGIKWRKICTIFIFLAHLWYVQNISSINICNMYLHLFQQSIPMVFERYNITKNPKVMWDFSS